MPDAYFRLVDEADQLRHLRAIASLFDATSGRPAGDDDVELRVAGVGQSRHVTYVRRAEQTGRGAAAAPRRG